MGAVTLSGCSPVSDPSGTGWLPNQYRAQADFPVSVRGRVPIDPADPSIVRDDEKCILCGQCEMRCPDYAIYIKAEGDIHG